MTTPRAKKSLGQNFLVDRRATQRILAALNPREGEPVLEIGPGHGALTESLIETTGRIAAVEIDDHLASRLEQRHDTSRLILFRRDVLQLDLSEVLGAFGAAPGTLAIVGNLPYNISKRVVRKLVSERRQIDRAVLMFQREVAERITSGPGSRNYGPISVMTGLAYRVESVFDLRPHAFRPRPKVVSTVTRWARRHDFDLDDSTEQRLHSVLSVCFARRRRTVRNNLRSVLPDDRIVEECLKAAEIDGDLRAEKLEPATFLRLAAVWHLPPLL